MIANLNEVRTSLRLIIIIFATIGCITTGNRQDVIGFPEASTTPEWTKNMSIYEVNIRQYTPEGTVILAGVNPCACASFANASLNP